MKPYFVGHLNFAPQNLEEPDLWQLEEAYGLVYNNYFLIVLPWHKTDGASIPWFLRWLLGKPFGKKNKFWAVFHDGGYNRYCVVVDLRTTSLAPFQLLEVYDILEEKSFVPPSTLSRDWWDRMARDGSMVAAKCRKWKRKVVYSGLKKFGWYSWNKYRRQKEI